MNARRIAYVLFALGIFLLGAVAGMIAQRKATGPGVDRTPEIIYVQAECNTAVSMPSLRMMSTQEPDGWIAYTATEKKSVVSTPTKKVRHNDNTPVVVPTATPLPPTVATDTPEPTEEPKPTPKPTKTPRPDDDDDDDKHCNKGEGNGGEDCDPGNNPDKGNDDED